MFKKAENPMVFDTWSQRFREFVCRHFGHIRYGIQTGLPQATCKRCGRKLPGAIDAVPEWRVPD